MKAAVPDPDGNTIENCGPRQGRPMALSGSSTMHGSARQALFGLRLLAASTLFIHGSARVLNGGVAGFGAGMPPSTSSSPRPSGSVPTTSGPAHERSSGLELSRAVPWSAGGRRLRASRSGPFMRPLYYAPITLSAPASLGAQDTDAVRVP